jgi:hypothetical protein
VLSDELYYRVALDEPDPENAAGGTTAETDWDVGWFLRLVFESDGPTPARLIGTRFAAVPPPAGAKSNR